MIEVEFAQHDKGIYEKLKANLLNRERLKHLHKFRNKTRMPAFPLPFNIVPEVLTKAIRQ